MKAHVELSSQCVLVTGAAGFIGAHLVRQLLQTGAHVIGLDNLNTYYEPTRKTARLTAIQELVDRTQGERAHGDTSWTFVRGDIADATCVKEVFQRFHPRVIVHLAGQAGVRWSITHPDDYIQSNIVGFYNMLEACRHATEDSYDVEHFVYASSSSVYGGSQRVPFSTDDPVDRPVSLYAATKKTDELLAHAYAKLYAIPCTGLRFFTVYGPEGRPDMAYFSFAEKLRRGETIRIFNYGKMERDFTYVDDIVEGTLRVIQGAPLRQVGEDGLPIAPYDVYNIGCGQPVRLMDFVSILQQELVRAGVLPPDYDFDAHRELVPMQPGDVPVTYADTTRLAQDYGYRPSIDLRTGLRKFALWYRQDVLTRKAGDGHVTGVL